MRRMDRREVLAGAAALGLAGAGGRPAFAADRNLRVHTGGPGSSVFVFTTTWQTVVQQSTDYVMNVTAGQTSTRSTLDAARGQVDFYISSPSINHYMKNRQQMYTDMAEAPDLYRNIRSLANFPLGPYHAVAYADSGIETLEDCRGRRIFLGPPGGAATTVALAIVESATGMKPGDYEQARLDWTSGIQAFQDRQVDLAILPTELPSPVIMQYALLSKIRLVDIPQQAFAQGPLKEILATPGMTVQEIAGDVYGDNQVNEGPVKAIGSWVGVGTQKEVPEETVYAVVKAMFDHLDTFHLAAEWMRFFTPETALRELNAPLHAGAWRWYVENGFEIPPEAVPVEAS